MRLATPCGSATPPSRATIPTSNIPGGTGARHHRHNQSQADRMWRPGLCHLSLDRSRAGHERLCRGQGAGCLAGRHRAIGPVAAVPDATEPAPDRLPDLPLVRGRRVAPRGAVGRTGLRRPATPGQGSERERASELLRAFLAHAPEPVNDPRELAERLARLTHLIRDTIIRALARDDASDLLRDLRQAFEQTLVPDQSAEDFADMFAQTLAYGLSRPAATIWRRPRSGARTQRRKSPGPTPFCAGSSRPSPAPRWTMSRMPALLTTWHSYSPTRTCKPCSPTLAGAAGAKTPSSTSTRPSGRV